MVQINSVFALSYLVSLAPYDIATLVTPQGGETTIIGRFICKFTMFWTRIIITMLLI